MAQTITIKRGLKADLPVLEPLEIGYCTDTREVFIGSANGNIPIVEALTGAIIVALINAGEDKINDANLSANVADAINKKHSHSNLAVLNDIQESFTTALKTKLDSITSGATKVEDSATNGNVKINDAETNVYAHPATHPGSMITEDNTHRWTTDAEKSNWNNANSQSHTHDNLTILQSITQALIDAWNSAVDHISDTVKHITSAERTLWNTVSGKVNKSGDTMSGQLKIHGIAANRPLVTRGISGTNLDVDDSPDDLYLNYDSNKVVHIGTTINIDPVNKTINAKADDSGKLNGHDASYYAPIASPTFTGTPKAPTPTTTDSSTNIATTAFVKAQGYITAAGSGAKIAVSSSAPSSPQPGDFWYKTT